MAKRKEFMNTVKTFSFWEWLHVMAVIGGLAALIIACVNHLNNQKADTDQKIEEMHRRTESIERTMAEIKTEIAEVKAEISEIKTDLKKSSDLLHADLSWRYVYQNHPDRKKFSPRYDIDTRTLEFVDTRNVRNP